MFVNGRYIPSSHPLHKPGRYKSLDDAWSHTKIESTELGEVYVVVNDAWPEWVKVGKAVSSEDRLNGYQTSSPFRDYSVIATLTAKDRHAKEREMHKAFTHFSDERRGEWFKIDRLKAINIFNVHAINDVNKSPLRFVTISYLNKQYETLVDTGSAVSIMPLIDNGSPGQQRKPCALPRVKNCLHTEWQS